MRRCTIKCIAVAVAAVAAIAGAGYLVTPAGAADTTGIAVAPGLVLPRMDPERGKELFASKGCVVCHSINGVGGTDAARLDASTMTPQMNPFAFFARMWRGAEPMIKMQHSELGHQVEFDGQDLADIVAFVHNAEVQKTFSESDIPAEIKAHMEGGDDSGGTSGMMQGQGGMMGNGGMMGGSSNGQ